MVTAIFPMRGQPPHIGHVLSIVRIYDEYDKIILHVASKPSKQNKRGDFIIPPEEVVAVLKEIFRYMPKVEVILREKHLRDRTSFEDLPHFDVIVTGNKEFIRAMKCDKPVRLISRSTICGYDISGTTMRTIMRAQGKRVSSNAKL